MPLSDLTLLESQALDGTPTALTSDAFAPTADVLLIVACVSWGTVTSQTLSISDTLTGTGSWTQYTVEGTASGFLRTSLFVAIAGASPGTGTVTCTASASRLRMLLEVMECTGYDTTTPVAQSASNSGGAGTLTVTLGSTPGASSMVVGAVGFRAGTDAASGTGFTELIENTVGTGPAMDIQVQRDLTGADTTCDWTGGLGSTNNSAVAIEINELAGVLTVSPKRRLVMSQARHRAARW